MKPSRGEILLWAERNKRVRRAIVAEFVMIYCFVYNSTNRTDVSLCLLSSLKRRDLSKLEVDFGLLGPILAKIL